MKSENEDSSSKNKTYRLIAGSLIFIMAGIWMFFNPDLYHDFPLKIFRNPIVIKSIGAIGVLFFGLTGIIGIKKLINRKLD